MARVAVGGQRGPPASVQRAAARAAAQTAHATAYATAAAARDLGRGERAQRQYRGHDKPVLGAASGRADERPPI